MDRYEEALERAKAAIKDCGDNLGRKKMIYGIFPELQESEDEKNWGQIFACITDDALKEWLEKKKEKIIADLTQTAEEKEYVRTIKSLVADAIRATECVEVKEEVHGEIIAQSGPDTAFYQRLIDWAEGRHVDRTAEWSDEDEHRRTDAIYFLETARKQYALKSAIDEAIDWLKSLRPQPNNNLRWRRATEGANLPESIIMPDGDDPRFGKCAVKDSWYIPISEHKELPKE